MFPEDVRRDGNHPAPFPEKLPGRLIRLYTNGAVDEFPGEIVLDPFCGTGATCAVAAKMARRFIGIDICEPYVEMAKKRMELVASDESPLILVGRAKYPGKDELLQLQLGTAGRSAEKKHRRKTYGRKVKMDDSLQLYLYDTERESR